MDKQTIQLHHSWLAHLKNEFQKDYMVTLKYKLQELKKIKLFFTLEASRFLMPLISLPLIK